MLCPSIALSAPNDGTPLHTELIVTCTCTCPPPPPPTITITFLGWWGIRREEGNSPYPLWLQPWLPGPPPAPCHPADSWSGSTLGRSCRTAHPASCPWRWPPTQDQWGQGSINLVLVTSTYINNICFLHKKDYWYVSVTSSRSGQTVHPSSCPWHSPPTQDHRGQGSISYIFVTSVDRVAFNPFSTGTGWTLYKVYGGFRISYGTG